MSENEMNDREERREESPEYIRDLLTRLRETLDVYEQAEEETEKKAAINAGLRATALTEEITEEIPVISSLPAEEAPLATEPESTAEPIAEEEDDGLPPWEIPEEEKTVSPPTSAVALSAAPEEPIAPEAAPLEPEPIAAAEEDATAAEEDITAAESLAPLTEDTPVEDESPTIEEPTVEAIPVNEEPAWEPLTLDSMIDTLIAEKRAEKQRATTPAAAPSRADEVTDEIFAAAAPMEDEPAPAEPTPAAEVSRADGIWDLTPTDLPAAPKKAARRFRMRLVTRRGGERPPVEVRDVGTSTPLTEERVAAPAPEAEELLGALRPQDFFIADLRREELTAETGEEYISRNQIETISVKYEVEKRGVTRRFAISVFLAVFVLLYENLSLLGVYLSDLVGIGPHVATLLDMGLLLAASLLVTDSFKNGVNEIFAWQYGTDAITLISLFISFLLLLVHLILGSAEGLAALPGVLAVSLSLGFRRLRIRDEEATFRHLCESGDKLALEDVPALYATEEAALLGRRVKDVLRIKKVGFVTGYFARVRKTREDHRLHTVLVLSGLGAMLLATLLYAVLAPTAKATEILSLTSWLSVPLSLSLFYGARRLSYHRLSECAEANATAVLGESSAEDYAAAEAIAFEDVEAYPSRKVHVRKIKLYEDRHLDEVLYYMAGVFSVLGGPLDGVFRVSASELGLSSDVTLLSTADGGFEATVDGARVSVGGWSYFPEDIVAPYHDTEDVYAENEGNLSIMYAAIDGTVAAKFYIEYEISGRFERDAARLAKNGVQVLVRTFDPNVGDALLATTLHRPDLRIRAVRKRPDQMYDFAESRVDSGIVTGAGSRDLIKALFLCQNYRKATRLLALLKTVALPLSVLAALLAALLGSGFHSIYGALLSLLWLLPVAFIAGAYFKKER